MKVLAMADESTLDEQRKYLRWPSQVLAFFGALLFLNCFMDLTWFKSPKDVAFVSEIV